VKYLLPVCQILRNFTEGNARKFTVSFAFCAHVDVLKYRKTLTLSFERAQITFVRAPLSFIYILCNSLGQVTHLDSNGDKSTV